MLTPNQLKKIEKNYEKIHPNENWLGKWICDKCGCITTDPGWVNNVGPGGPPIEALCNDCEETENYTDEWS